MTAELERPPTTTAGGSVTVVLVDDHELIRAGLRRHFREDDGFSILGEAGSKAEAIEMVERLGPDVVVMDIGLPDGSGITATSELRARDLDLGIVVLTMYTGDEQLFAAMNAGASAFIGKDLPADEVVATVRHAAEAPGAFVAHDLAAAMERRSKRPVLTGREHEVLDLLADGLDVRRVGRELYIADATVKSHILGVYRKLGVGNRVEMVVAAIRLGLIGLPRKPWDPPHHHS